jgi:ankyrin repeat protein
MQSIETATPLLIAAGMNDRLDILNFMLRRHATIEHKNNIGNSPLTLALLKGHADYVDALLDNGANIHTYDGFHTPLTLTHNAIQKFPDDADRFRKIESRLLIKGAHVDVPTNRLNWTPLFHTSTRQQNSTIKMQMDLLLHLGADVNYTDTNGRTALMLACSTGREYAVKRLLDNYADTNKVDHYGWSALMFGVYYNHHQIVHMLLEYGADVNMRSQRGLNALQIAIQHQRKVMIDLLLDYGAEAEDENRE